MAGVFRDSAAAGRCADELRQAGFKPDQINLLTPGSTEEQIHSIPTSTTEPPGVGGAIGGVVGGALGLAGGFELGVGVTSLIPGVGPIFAAGVAAAALFGAGGIVAGTVAGDAVDKKDTEGVPSDEIFFYEDALRKGKSVVFVLANSGAEERRARRILGGAGAESLDAARDDWWVGLRDVEAEHYRALGHNFERDQDTYRLGFESAQRRECRGLSFAEAADCLKWWYPDSWDSEPFRHGYERGLEYRARQDTVKQSGGY